MKKSCSVDDRSGSLVHGRKVVMHMKLLSTEVVRQETEMNKPLGRKSYGSIPHLPGSRLGPADHAITEGQARIATKKARDWRDLIIVQEKLDGSNVAVAKIDGAIVPIGRAGYLATTSPHKQHHLFADWVMENKQRFSDMLNERERICGEWLLLRHGTEYALHHEPFVVFDLFTPSNERLTYHDFLLRVLPHGFTVPYLVHMGSPCTIDRAMRMLGVGGHGALGHPEGCVWRVERDGKVNFLAKYVRTDKVDRLPDSDYDFNNMPDWATWKRVVQNIRRRAES